MIYYRIAWKHHQSSIWQWKSTYLTSLEAVSRFLRLHSAIPLDQLRVFASSSGEDFNALLEEENKGWQHPSVTVEQFLCEQGLPSSKMIGEGIRKEEVTC